MPKLRTSVHRPLMTGHWCRVMATLLASGLSAQQVMVTIKTQAEHDFALADACSKALVHIEQGASLVTAIAHYHFFNRYQLEQLKIGELSGSLPTILLGMASRTEQQYDRNQRLKIQLKLSQAIIVIGSIAGMMLAMAKGASLLPHIVALMMVVIITKVVYRLLDADVFYLLAVAWTNQLIQKVDILKRLFEYYWYLLLATELEAGIDPLQAIINLHDLFPSPSFRHNCRVCQRHLEQGQSLLWSLSQAQLLLTMEMKQVLLIGEQSGRLVETLKHHLMLEEQRLEVLVSTFYEWLPRFYYLMTVSVVLRFMM